MPAPENAQIRRVLLASDFSPGSRKALRRVQHLPLSRSAEIVLAHVMPAGDHPQDLTKASKARLGRELDTLRAGLQRKRRADVQVRAATPSGTPPVEVVKLARECAADLIVCGRHGAGKMRALLLGSTAERIAHASEAPVLVVGTQLPNEYRAPLVAVTADEQARAVLDAALGVIPAGTRVDVVSGVSVPMEGWLWGGWMTSKEILRLRKLTRESAERALAPIIAEYRERSVRLRLALREGDPRTLILSIAKRRSADLIAVGTRSRAGVVRFHLGSVAAHVVRHAACDVLVVRTPGAMIEAR